MHLICNKTKQDKASTAAGQPGLTRWTLGVAAWPTWAWTCPKRRPFRPQLVPLVRGEIPAGGLAGRKRKRLMNLFKRCHMVSLFLETSTRLQRHSKHQQTAKISKISSRSSRCSSIRCNMVCEDSPRDARGPQR